MATQETSFLGLSYRIDAIDSKIEALVDCTKSLADSSKLSSHRIEELELIAEEFKDAVKNANRIFAFVSKVGMAILVTLVVNAIKAFL